jgi:hypothetical protein
VRNFSGILETNGSPNRACVVAQAATHAGHNTVINMIVFVAVMIATIWSLRSNFSLGGTYYLKKADNYPTVT